MYGPYKDSDLIHRQLYGPNLPSQNVSVRLKDKVSLSETRIVNPLANLPIKVTGSF